MKRKFLVTILAMTMAASCFMTGCSASAGTKVGRIEVAELFDEADVSNYKQVLKDLDLDDVASAEKHKMKNGDGSYTLTIDDKEYVFTIEDNEITEVKNDKDKVIWPLADDKDDEKHTDDKKDDDKKPSRDDDKPSNQHANDGTITSQQFSKMLSNLTDDFETGIELTFVQDGETMVFAYSGNDMCMYMDEYNAMYVIDDYAYVCEDGVWYYTEAENSGFGMFSKESFLATIDVDRINDAIDDSNETLDIATTTVSGHTYSCVVINDMNICFDDSTEHIVAFVSDDAYMLFDKLNSAIKLPDSAKDAEYVGADDDYDYDIGHASSSSGSTDLYDYDGNFICSFSIPSGFEEVYSYAYKDGKYLEYEYSNKKGQEFEIECDSSTASLYLYYESYDGESLGKIGDLDFYRVFSESGSDFDKYIACVGNDVKNEKDTLVISAYCSDFTQDEFEDIVLAVLGKS